MQKRLDAVAVFEYTKKVAGSEKPNMCLSGIELSEIAPLLVCGRDFLVPYGWYSGLFGGKRVGECYPVIITLAAAAVGGIYGFIVFLKQKRAGRREENQREEFLGKFLINKD